MLKRRAFLQYSAALATIPLTRSFGKPFAQDPVTLPAWLTALVALNDAKIARFLAVQDSDPGSPTYGGLADGQEIYNPHSTAGFVQTAACSLFAPGSSYHRASTLVQHMHRAVQYLLTLQHPDGTIDLLSTNFHSTPDTAFLVKRLVNAYTLIEKSGTPDIQPLLKDLRAFLLKGGEALSVGGIHTPNHRWVVCAALAKLQEHWPHPAYTRRIEQWLAEGIDMDPDGQYNERSTFIYSPLSDRILISIAKGVNKPHLLDYVRRNLDMTLYYVHPNGEVVTDVSGRQDKALIGTMENYYYPYRYLAIHDQNPVYAAMCHHIEQTAGAKIGSFLDYYLTDSSLWGALPVPGELPTTYVKAFPHSGIIRIREDTWDSTLISKNPVWCTFMKGNAVLQGIRFASSFFGKGQFQTSEITPVTDGWQFTQHLEGPYYQPLPATLLPGDGDWQKMSRPHRPQSEVQILDTTIVIRKSGQGLTITISTSGTERVPVALELIFRAGGTFEGVTPVQEVADSWLLKEGAGAYRVGDDTIAFGPGLARHANTALRGSLPHSGSPTVYLTGFTPFQHTITLN